jgi:hypothetical protein
MMREELSESASAQPVDRAADGVIAVPGPVARPPPSL